MRRAGWIVLGLMVCAVGGGFSAVLAADDGIVVSRPHQSFGSRLYLGAAAGYADYQEMEDGGAGFSVYGGYRLDELLAVELSWMDLGDASKGGKKVEVSALTAAVVGTWPLRTDLAAFARLGLAGWDYESSRGAGKEDDSGTDLWFGIGLDYDIGARSSVRFAGDLLFMEPELAAGQVDERIFFLSVGFVYRP